MMDGFGFRPFRSSRPFGPALGAALALALALACTRAPESAGSTHEFTITEQDGVTVARTTGGPTYEGEIFVYEKVLEIRPDESRPETLFFFLAGRAIDDEGNLYVSDANANRISVFDPEGNWLRDIGRQGQGPGEFQTPTQVEYADGIVRVRDVRKRGTHLFTPTGELIGFERWPAFTVVGSMVPQIWPTATGGTVIHLLAESRMVDRLEGRPGDNAARNRAAVLVYDEEGTEIARVEGPWVKMAELRTYTWSGREATSQVPVYFAPQPWGGYAPGRGVWLSTGAEPSIEWYGLDGVLFERWEIDLPAVPVTDEDRALVQELLAEQVRDAANPEPGIETSPIERLRVLADNPLFAAAKPYWGIPRVDTYGFMWLPSQPPVGNSVERALAERGETSRFFRILSPAGEYLGDTTPPAAGTIERGHLLTSATDPETEERYPVVYRMRPAVEGLEYAG
jgi:hypothetical protein